MRLNILDKSFSIFRDTLAECVANNTLKAKLNVSLLNNFLTSTLRVDVKKHFALSETKSFIITNNFSRHTQ
jgi:hypothetical protein